MFGFRNVDRSRLDGRELEIFKLVREGSTFEQWREWLRVPLEHAAAKGDLDLFTRLMDAGADDRAGWRGCEGRTLLAAAACGESEDIVGKLLKAGAHQAEVNVRFGLDRQSALHVAALQGAERVSNALIRAGADPNMQNAPRESPLHRAALKGHDGVVNTLVLAGADPNAFWLLRRTPLHMATGEGHALCVSKLVISGADKDSCDNAGATPLHLAAQKNHHAAVNELLAAGASIDIRLISHPRWRALDAAAAFGQVDIVRTLLRHGSSVSSSEENSGFTALHHAVDNDEPDLDNGDVIRVLLEAGADIEAKRTFTDSTPLHLAAVNRSAESGTIRALLEGGANVSARDRFGGTPLHDACYYCCVGAVEALLRWGADEELTNRDDETAEDRLDMGEEEVEDMIESGEEDRDAEEREADYQRINDMLARAPADRSWRRRGWLVLARSCPAKVQLKMEGNSSDGDGSNGNSAETANIGCGDGDRARDRTADLVCLVGRVVGLDVEGVFRLVVGFL